MSNFYTINGRNYTIDADNISLTLDENAWFCLDYLGVVAVDGAGWREFLQGQMSCDIRNVSTKMTESGLVLDTAGRIVVIADVMEPGNLLVVRDLIAPLIKDLGRAAMFSRIGLQDVSDDYQIYGYYRQNATNLDFLPQMDGAMTELDEGWCYNSGDGFFIFILKNIPEYVTKVHGSLLWHLLQLQHGRVEIYPDTIGKFLPDRLELQHRYINFNKGCYRGQEIVARLHYRGQQKHEFIVTRLTCTEEPYAGKKIENNNKPAIIVDLCPLGDNDYLIAMVN